MEIKLIKPSYKNDEDFYKLFLENKLWGLTIFQIRLFGFRIAYLIFRFTFL